MSQSGTMTLRVDNDAPNYDSVEQTSGNAIALTTTWTKVTVDFSITKSAPSWDYYVGVTEVAGPAQNGDCFLVDDVAVTRLK